MLIAASAVILLIFQHGNCWKRNYFQPQTERCEQPQSLARVGSANAQVGLNDAICPATLYYRYAQPAFCHLRALREKLLPLPSTSVVITTFPLLVAIIMDFHYLTHTGHIVFSLVCQRGFLRARDRLAFPLDPVPAIHCWGSCKHF